VRLDGKAHLMGVLCAISTAMAVASAAFWPA
jgi:hypothetical protein